MKMNVAVSLVLVTNMVTMSAAAQTHSYAPPGGMIADAAIARDLAKVYLIAVYGKKQIEYELPLSVSLKEKVWTVKGILNGKRRDGGVAEIDLAQQDGRVLRLTHGM
jgi:hypothetical protein